MPELHRYKIFIGHAWEYNDDYYRLIDYLDKAPNFIYSNYSVPEHDPLCGGNKDKLKEELKKQIRPVEVVLILAGMYVAYSDWIQFEIDFSGIIEKPIIGIKPWGSDKVPQSVQDAAVEIVGWNTDSIVNAIRKHT